MTANADNSINEAKPSDDALRRPSPEISTKLKYNLLQIFPINTDEGYSIF